MRVGEHGRHVHIGRGQNIGAGEHADVDRRRTGGAVGMIIGADVGEGLDPQRQKLVVLVERQFGLGDVVAALLVGQQAFAALGNPFHRPAEHARRGDAENVFVVERALHAEAAADIFRNDAHLVVGHFQNFDRQRAADEVRTLHGAAQRDAVVARDRIRRGSRAAPSNWW